MRESRNLHNLSELKHFENVLFDPCDPYMTFEVKLLMTFVAIHPLVILTKFGQNPIRHMWEKKQIVRKKKEEEEEETTRKK